MIGVFMISLQQQSIRELYNGLYKKGYPHGGLGFPISWSGIDIKNLSCLDLGCGHGVLGRRFKRYTGVDISDYVIKQNAIKYPELEFYSVDIKEIDVKRYFNIVIALDVLEHFPKNEIDEYLKTIAELNTNMFLFSICCRKSGYRSVDCGELHTCIMTKNEWLEILNKNFKVIDVSEMNRQQTFCVKAKK